MNRTATSTLALSLATLGTSSVAELTTAPDAWELLSQIEITETITDTSYRADKVFPEALTDAAAGFTIIGYAVPYAMPGQAVDTLMVVADMGDCPFCGASDHAGSLEVRLATPITGLEDGARIALTGDLELITDPETWQSAILRNARVVTG
ncbi:MAG: hypothetical protein AAF092_00890 [Pseudomonadota bacterium]